MAGSKRVRLYIDADSSGVQKGIGGAQRSLRGFEGSAKHTEGVIKGLSNTASTLGLAFGAGGLALGIQHSITAFKESEKQNARTSAQLKTLGVNTDAVRKKIEEVTLAQSKLSGFQENELKGSFATLLTSTGNVTDALKLNATAMDFARLRHLPLEQAAKILGKVWDGNVSTLNRYGIHVAKGTTATEALRLVQEKAAGQAKTFGDTTAGASDKASAKIELLQEKIGGQLAPALNEAAGATIHFAGATGSLIDKVGGLGPLVAGAAGFGAFKLLAPGLGNAGKALGALGKVAGEKGAGTSFRVLGSAVADSIGPMNAAGIGASILAGGIYELYSNSESADQAVSGLNSTIKGLNAALDQKQVARDAVNSAKDFVNSTKASEQAARANAKALHAQLVELTTHKGTTAQVAAAEKKWQKALADVVPAVHQHEQAVHNLSAAQKNLRDSTDGVNAAAGEQNRKARDVTSKVIAQTQAVQNHAQSWREYGKQADSGLGIAASQAGHFASLMDKAAQSTKHTDSAVSKADTNLAGFARHIGRLPTIREIKLVTHYTAQGLSLDELEKKIDSLHSKAITLTTTINPITGRTVTPKPPKPPRTGPPYKQAAGAFVAGDYAAGDRVPALLSGGEAVLNPMQIGLVDSGMSVMGALGATGAPTIGHGFAAGKKPAHSYGGREYPTGKALTPAQMVAAALDRRSNSWDLAGARAQLRISQADAAGDAAGNVAAYQFDATTETNMIRSIQQILANPAKALGVKGAQLSKSQRTTLLQALAGAISQRTGDFKTIYDLQHPADNSGGDTSGATDSSGNPVDTGPTPDEQAQLDQKQTIINNLTRANQLGAAELSAFGSSGDIGTGNFANAFDAGRGTPVLSWSSPASTAQVATAATQGMGSQPSISSNATSVRI